MADNLDPVQKVLADWRNCQNLVHMAARGHMANVQGAGDLTRRDLVHNVEVLKPVLEHFGS